MTQHIHVIILKLRRKTNITLGFVYIQVYIIDTYINLLKLTN